MPSVGLNIRINAAESASKDIERVEGAVASLKRRLDQLQGEARETTRANKKMEGSFRQLKTSMGGVHKNLRMIRGSVAALGAVFATGFIVKGTKDALGFRAALASLGGDSVRTRESFEGLQKQLDHTFGLEALVAAQGKINAFGLDLKLTPDLLEGIQRKAQQMQIDTAFALDSFILGLARTQTRILDNIGITFKAKDAYDEYGKTINKLGRDLKAYEQQTAFTQYAVKILNQDTTKISDEFKKAQQITALMADAVLGLKEQFIELAPAIIFVLDKLNSFVDILGKFTWEGVFPAFDNTTKRLSADYEKMITQFIELRVQRDWDKRAVREAYESEAEFNKARAYDMELRTRDLKKYALLKKRLGEAKETGLAINLQNQLNKMMYMGKSDFDALITYIENKKMPTLRFGISLEGGPLESIKRNITSGASDVGGLGGMRDNIRAMFREWGKIAKKKPTKATGPTKAERLIDLEILDLQFQKMTAVSEKQELLIKQQIEMLQLKKKEVDRQKDTPGQIDKERRNLQLKHKLERKAANQKVIDTTMTERSKAIARNNEDNWSAARHTLDMEIARLETEASAGVNDQRQLSIDLAILELELKYRMIGATERQIELFKEQYEADKNNILNQEKSINGWYEFADAFANATNNMSSFRPEWAATMGEIQKLARVFGDSKKSTGQLVDATIQGVGMSAAAFVDGEREKAAILSAMEFAQAAANFWNPPAAIAHGIAGAMFAAVAAGAGGGAAKEPAAPPAAQGSGQIVVNFGTGVVLGTPQDVGRAIYAAQDSLVGTGMVTGKV